MFLIGMFIGFLMGAITIAMFAAKKAVTDDECKNCSSFYEDRIKYLEFKVNNYESKLHGMRSTNGKLGKEIQNLVFLKEGFKP